MPHKDVAMYILIDRDIQDMGDVMEARPPRCSAMLFVDSKTWQRGSRAYMTCPTLHIKKCLYDKEVPQRHSERINMCDPGRHGNSSWILAILALTSASRPSRAGSPLKLS